MQEYNEDKNGQCFEKTGISQAKGVTLNSENSFESWIGVGKKLKENKLRI